MKIRLCEAVGCQSKHFALGFCRKHHARFIRNGTTKSKYDMTRHTGRIDEVKDDRPGYRGYMAVNVINDIKFKAKKRKKNWSLSHTESFKMITSPCDYCGFVPEWPNNRVGIDRVDNTKGYTPNNCVSCCFTCNSAKKELTRDDFLAWIKKAYLKNFT